MITLSVVNDTFLTSEIEIANTEQRDTATYTCSANNSAGVVSQTLFLQVLGIPQMHILLYSNVIFKCLLEADVFRNFIL